jgi:hypothetical protein
VTGEKVCVGGEGLEGKEEEEKKDKKKRKRFAGRLQINASPINDTTTHHRPITDEQLTCPLAQ